MGERGGGVVMASSTVIRSCSLSDRGIGVTRRRVSPVVVSSVGRQSRHGGSVVGVVLRVVELALGASSVIEVVVQVVGIGQAMSHSTRERRRIEDRRSVLDVFAEQLLSGLNSVLLQVAGHVLSGQPFHLHLVEDGGGNSSVSKLLDGLQEPLVEVSSPLDSLLLVAVIEGARTLRASGLVVISAGVATVIKRKLHLRG